MGILPSETVGAHPVSHLPRPSLILFPMSLLPTETPSSHAGSLTAPPSFPAFPPCPWTTARVAPGSPSPLPPSVTCLNTARAPAHEDGDVDRICLSRVVISSSAHTPPLLRPSSAGSTCPSSKGQRSVCLRHPAKIPVCYGYHPPSKAISLQASRLQGTACSWRHSPQQQHGPSQVPTTLLCWGDTCGVPVGHQHDSFSQQLQH